jgi:hypothetical protein
MAKKEEVLIMEKDKVNLFDFLKSISDTKEALFELEDLEKKYPAFMLNRFLCASQDTLFYANVMSQMSHLPNVLQYAFLFHGIGKKKRYFQYSGKGKKDKTEEVESIVKYYSCSREQALDYQELLSPDQIERIVHIYAKRISKGNLK